jgi:hypothetical protein
MGNYLDDKFGQTFHRLAVEFILDNYDIEDLYTDKEIRAWLEEKAKDYDYERAE